MRGIWIALIVIILAFTGISFTGYLDARAWRREAVIKDSAALAGILAEWNDRGKPNGQQLANLLERFSSKSAALQLFTNEIEINGLNYQCQFMSKDTRFEEKEPLKLVITTNGMIIRVKHDVLQIISEDNHK